MAKVVDSSLNSLKDRILHMFGGISIGRPYRNNVVLGTMSPWNNVSLEQCRPWNNVPWNKVPWNIVPWNNVPWNNVATPLNCYLKNQHL